MAIKVSSNPAPCRQAMEGIISFYPRVIAAVPDESYQLVEMIKKSSALYERMPSMPLRKRGIQTHHFRHMVQLVVFGLVEVH